MCKFLVSSMHTEMSLALITYAASCHFSIQPKLPCLGKKLNTAIKAKHIRLTVEAMLFAGVSRTPTVIRPKYGFLH